MLKHESENGLSVWSEMQEPEIDDSLLEKSSQIRVVR